MSELATTTATTGTATPGETKNFDNCVIKDAGLYEPRFPDRAGPDDYDVMFTVTIHEDGQPDRDVEVNLEVSSAYGVGVNASKTRAQLAVEEVAKLGYTHGADLTKVAELVGKPCRLYGKVSSKGFWNYYFSSARPRTAAKDIASRMARLMGQQAAPAASPAPDANPFN